MYFLFSEIQNFEVEKLIYQRKMADQTPLPVTAVALYFAFACVALLLCLVSLIAIVRTKKTPYSTKVLSIGLLIFDSLFLISSSISKFFRYEDIFVLQHLTRALHVSSYVVVGTMALERLFVLNWPYLYLKVTTKRRTRIICALICLVALLQSCAVRGFACYASHKFMNCGMGIQVYFVMITVIVPIVSFSSYGKIFTIVRQKGIEHHYKYRLSQYKGTVVSFMYLINTTFNTIVYLGLATFYVIRSRQGVKEDGLLAMVTDCVNIINCIVDPLIYVVWFKETRLEILKMVMHCLPHVKPHVQKLRVDIFDITTSVSKSSGSTGIQG